jgi:hypothetical protein
VVGASDFDLYTAVALLFDKTTCIFNQKVDRPIQPPSVSVVSFYPLSLRAPKIFPKRQPGSFGLEVPQGEVERPEE